MKYKQYDLWLADLNPRFGTEAGKTRPVLIIQTDLLNKVHPSMVICPITTNVNSQAEILRVNLPKNKFGLRKESSIMIDQVRAIDNKRLIKRIGSLTDGYEALVAANLKIVLGIE